ncbi:MAG TPA: alpha/beta hydrolase-fold protein [Edaphobacter sp.]
MRLQLCFLVVSFAVVLPFATQAQEQVCKPTLVGHLDIFPLTSRVFHNTRMLRVWLPPGYEDAANLQRKYKVLYLLDGQSLFDACTAFEHEEMRADETLTALITDGKIEPIIVVGVDNGSPDDGKGGNTDNGEQRAREFLPYADPIFNPSLRDVAGDEFPGFMEREVMPPVEKKYRVLTGRENTGLGGVSYGGAATVYALIRRPDLFGSGIIESPSMQIGNGQVLRDTVSMWTGPQRVALGVGTEEAYDMPDAARMSATMVRDVTELAEHFKAIGAAPPKVQLTVAQGAHHSTRYFGERFAAALLFLYTPVAAK